MVMTPENRTIPLLDSAALFKAAQHPNGWLDIATRLAAAAELILLNEVAQEVPYFRAREEATQTALALACAAPPEGAGQADIECDPPNYLPAQLLYAFAMENVLKGLAIAKDPSLLSRKELQRQIKSHHLPSLAKLAAFEVAVQERPLLEAMSRIALWGGRYPVAAKVDEYPNGYVLSDPHELLDYGAHHPTMRRCFNRAVAELETLVAPGPRFDVVVVFPPKI
jgi:hypothetical protein